MQFTIQFCLYFVDQIFYQLTHWPLGDLDAILKLQFSISFYWLVSSHHLRSQESGVRSPLFSTTTKGYSTFCQQHKHKCNRNIIHGKCNDVFREWFAVVDGRHIKAKAAVMRLPRRHDFDLLLLRVLVIEYECIRKIVLFLCHEMMRSKKIKLIIKVIIKMKTKKNKW